MAIIDYRVEDGIAILTWDDKDRPMNVLSGDSLAELSAGVEKAVADDAVKGIILTSGKQGVFVAGGDLQQIESLGSGPIDAADLLKRTGAVLDQLRRMETCGKPVVAALNGVTLGGGYEIALACHRRILVNQRHAQVGLPEAGLGLMPAAGGTQRLPRLIGIQGALGLIMQGKQLAPDKALEKGLVDELVESQDLIPAAKKWINEDGNATQRWDEKRYEVPGGGADSVTFAQTMMGSNAMTHANTYGNMPSQQAILQSVYDGLGLPMDRAGKVETRQFIRVLQDPTARAMLRTLFFSLQECQKGARRPKDVPRFDVKRVGIIGAGLMGQGIAHVSAKVGIDVVLLDRDLASAERGKEKVSKTLERRLQKGRTTPDRVEGILSRIHATEDYSDLKGCDLVVEAVFEDRDIKAKVTKATDEQLGDDAIFASNTSGLPITGLAKASSRPANFIGLHFFSPVERMQMVEIVVGKETSQETLAKAWDYILKIKKAGIVVNDSPGFYTSRVFGTFISEGNHLLVEGVTPALIENAAKSAGMPMPPLSISDQVGLGTMHKAAKQAETDAAAAGQKWEPSPAQAIIASLISDHDRWGAHPPPKEDGAPRTPGGFYDYHEGGNNLWPDLSTAMSRWIESNDEQPSADIVRRRYQFVQCLEAVRCLEQGVITDVRDGDVGVIMAVGFPAFTGGPFTYIDNYGVADFVRDADELSARYGERFEPPKLLRDMAAEDRSFYS
ncbi:MAG: 3-hydroxyacyl-CoA dehydrogenase [Deltaproteobacteria bacterium]|nr:MAG: 3-hydroxyacyl-CoA dehydrogenase [Deltaproteobacteria bacterium]